MANCDGFDPTWQCHHFRFGRWHVTVVLITAYASNVNDLVGFQLMVHDVFYALIHLVDVGLAHVLNGKAILLQLGLCE